MKYNMQNEQASKIGNWIVLRIDKYEIILALVFIMTLFLKRSTDLPVGVFMALSLLALSTLYFFSGFAIIIDEHAGGKEIFVHKLASWSCSVGLISILYRLQGWVPYKIMAIVGCGTLLILLLVIFYLNSKKSELKLFNSRYIIRMILICFLGFYLAYTSTDVLIKNGIIVNKELINSYKSNLSSPENQIGK
jgi:hypothetical protein